MESIRIKKDDVYKIEVNDNGDYIEFDLLDIELPIKAMNLAKNYKRLYENHSKKIFAINKEYLNNKELLFRKKYEADKYFFAECRKAFDNFLGEGACQKIFGDTNRIIMFNELLEQLEPHFEKMQINVEKIKENLINKYSNSNEDKGIL